MGIPDPKKYLSEDAFNKLTMALSASLPNLSSEAYILCDGTTIIVKKLRNKDDEITALENPYDIKINGPTKVRIVYGEQDDEYDDAESVFLEAVSLHDLEQKWIKYRKDRNLDEDTVGIIDSINYTNDQQADLTYAKTCVNELMNIMLGTDIDIDDEDTNMFEMIDRLTLVNFILQNTSIALLKIGKTDKIHIPCAVIGEDGEIKEIKSFVDKDTFNL